MSAAKTQVGQWGGWANVGARLERGSDRVWREDEECVTAK